MADAVALADVVAALELGAKEHVALVGGGGKSTLLRTISVGRALDGRRVVGTTTTKMSADQDEGFERLLAPTDEEIVAAVERGPVMAWSRIDGGKAHGTSPVDCDRWFDLVDDVVVEADGARHRPFKAPSPFEPVVPSTTTLMISVIGADALGRVIADQCHRPLRVAALAGCSPYVRLSPEGAARVLLHERGARRALPATSRFMVAITKVDQATESAVDELMEALGSTATVAITSTNP